MISLITLQGLNFCKTQSFFGNFVFVIMVVLSACKSFPEGKHRDDKREECVVATADGGTW